MSYEYWPSNIEPPINDEVLDQQTLSRAIEQLANRTEYLKRGIDEYSLKNGRILLRGVAVDPSVQKGDCVFFNVHSSMFERALAGGEYNQEAHILEATERTFAVGLCVEKDGNTGGILCYGFSDLKKDFDIDPKELFDNTQEIRPNNNRAYLSNKLPGKLSSRPISPLIQLGVINEGISYICPLQKDIFESHLHYKFDIYPGPAATQNKSAANLTKTRGLNFTGTGENKRVFVDYSENAIMTDYVLCLKGLDGANQYSKDYPCRVEIDRVLVGSDYNIRIKVVFKFANVTAGLFPETSGSDSKTTYVPITDDLKYGDYIDVPDAGFSFAIVRRSDYQTLWTSGDTANSLFTKWSDVGSTLPVFKVLSPMDLNGWTNANPYVDRPGSAYRFMHECILSLGSVWPPTPLQSVSIETNGIQRMPDKEFAVDNYGIYWLESAVPPWTYEGGFSQYDEFNDKTGDDISGIIDKMVISTGVNMFLYFTKTSLENSRSVVLSLDSVSPMLSVTDCFTGKPSIAGHLKLDFDLSLAEDPMLTDGAYTCLQSIVPSENIFRRSTFVTELVEGDGIKIDIEQPNGVPGTLNKKCGKLKISRIDSSLEGSIEIVSLLNAKEEMINDIMPVVMFLHPSKGKCKMVSRVKVPHYGITSSSVSLKFYVSFFGTASVDAEEKHALFIARHHLYRKGMNLMNISEQTSFDSDDLTVSFVSYTHRKTLSQEQEIEVACNNKVAWKSSNGFTQDSETLIKPGDQIFTTWERVNSIGAATDTYVSDVGCAQIRWLMSPGL